MGERRQKSETVTREYTINLHKLLHKRHLYVPVIEERASERCRARGRAPRFPRRLRGRCASSEGGGSDVRGEGAPRLTLSIDPREHRTFKERAPKAVKAIRTFAKQTMKTDDVRLDVKLNKAVWARVRRRRHRRARAPGRLHGSPPAPPRAGGQTAGGARWRTTKGAC